MISFAPDKTDPNILIGKALGDVLIKAERLIDGSHAYRVTVDSDADGNIKNEISQIMIPRGALRIRVIRTLSVGKRESLPYEIIYFRDRDEKSQEHERFYWRPYYRTEGRIILEGREILFALLDYNGDGIFDRGDLSAGKSVGLDRNEDGRITPDEWQMGQQVLKIGSKSYLLRDIEPDGSMVKLTETIVAIPKLGDPPPKLSFQTLDGKIFKSENLKGDVYLLDFWASWCAPCVEKFSVLKRLDRSLMGKVKIILMNTDEGEQIKTAIEITEKHQLNWPQALLGQGQADPVWTMFGAMGDNQYAIPLYVLIDDKGVVRYAGSGGINLIELQTKIEETLRAR